MVTSDLAARVRGVSITAIVPSSAGTGATACATSCATANTSCTSFVCERWRQQVALAA